MERAAEQSRFGVLRFQAEQLFIQMMVLTTLLKTQDGSADFFGGDLTWLGSTTCLNRR